MDNFYISCDVGGTNLNIGLLSCTNNNQFTLIKHIKYKSNNFTTIIPALELAIKKFKLSHKFSKTPPICVCASGITDGNICIPSNLPKSYTISRTKISKKFNTNTFLINDFSAISYSIAILNNTQIIHIPNSPILNTTKHTYTHYTVVGVGTGLGVSQLHIYKKSSGALRYYAQACEGGWCNFCPSADNISLSLYRYLSKEGTVPVCWEDVISSSKGIPALYDFLKYKYTSDLDFLNACAKIDHTITRIKDISASISLCAKKNNSAAHSVMSLWSYLYARCCNNYSVFTLPNALFLAGGVAEKNKDFFLNPYNDTLFKQYPKNFISAFQKGYNNQFTNTILKKIPLYIISDYNVSLYGAALFAHIEKLKVKNTSFKI